MKYTLKDHIEKSFERLSKKDYLINDLLHGDGRWPGDWEGRALLAFCSLYSCCGKKATAMDEFISRIDEMIERIQRTTISILLKVQVRVQGMPVQPQQPQQPQQFQQPMQQPMMQQQQYAAPSYEQNNIPVTDYFETDNGDDLPF